MNSGGGPAAKTFTMDSKIKELYAHPVGHDILYKILLQMGLGEWLLTNPVVRNITLGQLRRLAGKRMGAGFFDTLCTLLNSEKDTPLQGDSPVAPKWWKEAVFYQIYPRSFMDSDGDGVGDLPGVLSKLDYLKELGVDALWLSPVYDSPNDDNGYDIRDYYKIADSFGGMEAFDALLEGVHARGMRLIMDLVVNHTSDEHAWFQDALAGPESLYRDFYHFKKSETGSPPNNWTSFFSGSAWNHYPEQGEWALHLFSKKQMDLNWDNETLRREIHKMIRWWLEKGVDGFRLDVINYISKTPGLPMGDEFVGTLMGYTGIEHYFYGPKLHDYLAEMRKEAFAPYDAFSVGETPGVGMEMSKLLTADYRGELDMVFSFDLLEMPGRARFDDYVYDLNYLKEYMINWMEHYVGRCWMSLFYDNHDNPRMVSKIDPSGAYRVPLSKLLAVIQFTLRGTPFLFQGQELGAVNQPFASIGDLRDVESLNLYEELCRTMPPAEAFRKVLAGSRDHARTPMRWDSTDYGGFSAVTPWIEGAADSFDALSQQRDEDSVWHFYKKLIALRKQSDALTYGGIQFIEAKRKDFFAYRRSGSTENYVIECNLSSRELRRPGGAPADQPLLSNYAGPSGAVMRPYEANIYLPVAVIK